MNEDIKAIIKEYLKENLSISISTNSEYNYDLQIHVLTNINVSVKLNDEEIAWDSASV